MKILREILCLEAVTQNLREASCLKPKMESSGNLRNKKVIKRQSQFGRRLKFSVFWFYESEISKTKNNFLNFFVSSMKMNTWTHIYLDRGESELDTDFRSSQMCCKLFCRFLFTQTHFLPLSDALIHNLIKPSLCCLIFSVKTFRHHLLRSKHQHKTSFKLKWNLPFFKCLIIKQKFLLKTW